MLYHYTASMPISPANECFCRAHQTNTAIMKDSLSCYLHVHLCMCMNMACIYFEFINKYCWRWVPVSVLGQYVQVQSNNRVVWVCMDVCLYIYIYIYIYIEGGI